MTASVAPRDRDEALDKVYEEIETNLIVSLMGNWMGKENLFSDSVLGLCNTSFKM